MLKFISIYICGPVIGITFGTFAWAVLAIAFSSFNSIPAFVGFNLTGIIVTMFGLTIAWARDS